MRKSKYTFFLLLFPLLIIYGIGAVGNAKTMQSDVPFTSQAPYAKWDTLHNDACEEASIIMAQYWMYNEKNLDKKDSDRLIKTIVKWEEENWKGHFDLSIAKTAELAQNIFGFGWGKTRILSNVTLQQLQEELQKGNIIIAPFAGRKLKNPYYSGRGPYYHMLVINGFDGKNFITNDPGTKRGKNFKYPQQRLFDALHDWPSEILTKDGKRVDAFGKHEKDVDILKGAKNVLVVEKQE
ncbi:MAG: C39 family peptidase [Parcubacteria group bacterium]|nr:C39 family peptidase [Parcubacteria group bacterium]